MNKLRDIIRYFCIHYPHSRELSSARLTKMVYLADWETARKTGKQLTNIAWYFNNYGPFVDDVINEAIQDLEVEVINTTNLYGSPKTLIRYVGNQKSCSLPDNDKNILDSIIKETAPKYWHEFIQYIYNSYPIKYYPRYSQLDLGELAQLEKEETTAF